MPRKPSAKKATNKAVASLLSALKFIEPAQSDIGQINQTHCMLAGNWAAAFNGLIMMAAKIDTDIVVYPNTKRLIGALSKCDEATQITQLDGGRLGIKSGKFQAYVPCIEAGLLAFTPPDPPQYAMNDSVIASLAIVGVIAKENAQRMVEASVLLQGNSAIATDGSMLFEHWHGTPMPSVVLPKVFITLLAKIGKKPVSLGASATSCTIYFEDESFVRTQLYTDPYPDTSRFLSVQNSPMPLPPEFFKALDKIESMKDDTNNVYFNSAGMKLQTSQTEGVGASFEYEHPLPNGIMFNINLLRMFAPHAKSADFLTGRDNKMAIFFGDGFRGVLMQKSVNAVSEPAPYVPKLTAGYTPSDLTGNPLDDEIPF